jgi:hypothetical protein
MMGFNVSEDPITKELILHFQSEWRPTEEYVSINTLTEQITLSTVELLILIGENCSRLGEIIEKGFADAALIITLDYQPVS